MLYPIPLLNLALSFLNIFLPSSDVAQHPHAKPTTNNTLNFRLRHMHAATSSAHIYFADVLPEASSLANELTLIPSVSIGTSLVRTTRPPSQEAFTTARHMSKHGQNAWLDWEESEVLGPDVTRRETLLLLAKMTGNTYVTPGSNGWYNLTDKWNVGMPVGWEPDDDGFRGYVFATEDNSTVVLTIKGTSVPIIGGGPTTEKDKLNDNLLFSCCCARVTRGWTPVCGCYRGDWKCNQECVETALIDESLFYPTGVNLYNNITSMYPSANIWVIGHSLGGALASLLGITFGAPVVAFEPPGERMASQRLHLPSPPSIHHITHVWHTADPIAMGTCTGKLSTCGIAGYAMESRCHLGNIIEYDTVTNLSWSVRLTNHPIATVIEHILSKPWPAAEEKGLEVPKSKDRTIDCFQWEFGNFTL
ncbi:alpha/beta-hydrolase [Multifurca ochricompacta]|uniref:triacylglycerol lipase n=1 Tax=Multifurca ochricompacta TaxID=376703 RepID=A0AAD4QPU2_9AGAM|nr:alpha/beta-hydrolase [Multifurca ochricompacta]